MVEPGRYHGVAASDPSREAAKDRFVEAEDAFEAARECLAFLGSSLCAAGAAAHSERAALREEISRLRMELAYAAGPGLSFDSCVMASAQTPGTQDLRSLSKTSLPGAVGLSPRRAATASNTGEVEKKASVVSWCRSHARQATTPSGRMMSPRSDDSRQHSWAQSQDSSVSPLDLKSRIRHSISKPVVPSVTDRYKHTGCCQAVAKSPYFEHITLAVIACNAIWIAIETDQNESDILVKAPLGFQIVEHLFCFFFSSELAVRLLSYRQKCDAWKDRWFVFDAVLVLLMVLETWVMTIVFVASSASGATGDGEGSTLSGASDATILRMLRLLRLTRMARIARLLRYVPELLVIIKGIVAAMRSVAVTLTLLALIIYVFAIVFRQLLKGSEAGSRYFGSVPDSMLSLIFYGIILEDTPDVVTAVGHTSFICAALLLVFILMASFTVLNMLIGVMCETVRVVSTVERETASLTDSRDRLLHLLRTSSLDADQNERISKAELQTLLQIPDACIVLRDLGIDVISLVDTADIIFQEQEELDFESFMDVVLQMRSCNKATVHDLVMQRKFLQQELSRLHALIARHMRQIRPPPAGQPVGNPLRYWAARTTASSSTSFVEESV